MGKNHPCDPIAAVDWLDVMSKWPAAWYPDPQGRHEFRYWDGAVWTEHVSNQGVATTDALAQPVTAQPVTAQPVTAQPVAAQPVAARSAPLAQSPGGVGGVSGGRVYVDASLRLGFKHRRLLVDEQAITWAQDRVPYDQITGYCHWVTAGVGNREYRLRLWTGKKNSTINFIGRGDEPRNAYDHATQALYAHVGRRALEDAIRRVEAGEPVEFAGWTFTRQGAALGRKQLRWADPLTMVTSDTVAGWWVNAVQDGKRKTIGLLSVDRQDAPLARRAFDICQARYGS
jgi:hypothetical protein